MRLESILLLAGASLIAACDLVPKDKEEPSAKEVTQAADPGGLDSAAGRRLCASAGTYQRLKALAFEEARRVRGMDAAPLDPLSRATVVRMEKPLVLSRDEGLGTTVCTGRLVVELPPGAAAQFNGMQRLVADVEYSAQEAADGSGPVFQMSGAEPIIFRLANFGREPYSGTAVAQTDTPEPEPSAEPAADGIAPVPPPTPPSPSPAPARQAERAPPPARAAPAQARRELAPGPSRADPAPSRAVARPSFNCRYASTPSERAVCADAGLAAKDRRMSSAYFSAYERASPAAKRQLSRSRAEFLRRRERCSSDDCIGETYDARVAEIRRIAEE